MKPQPRQLQLQPSQLQPRKLQLQLQPRHATATLRLLQRSHSTPATAKLRYAAATLLHALPLSLPRLSTQINNAILSAAGLERNIVNSSLFRTHRNKLENRDEQIEPKQTTNYNTQIL